MQIKQPDLNSTTAPNIIIYFSLHSNSEAIGSHFRNKNAQIAEGDKPVISTAVEAGKHH
jgi:hypothetical protein